VSLLWIWHSSVVPDLACPLLTSVFITDFVGYLESGAQKGTGQIVYAHKIKSNKIELFVI